MGWTKSFFFLTPISSFPFKDANISVALTLLFIEGNELIKFHAVTDTPHTHMHSQHKPKLSKYSLTFKPSR